MRGFAMVSYSGVILALTLTNTIGAGGVIFLVLIGLLIDMGFKRNAKGVEENAIH